MPDQLQPASPAAASYIGRIDPRARLVAAVALSVMLAAALDLAVLGLGLAVAILALVPSGLPLRVVLRRLLPLNVLILLMGMVLLMTADGPLLAATIALKGNAIVLTLLVLLGSLEATTLGHTLSHLRVPDKLTQLLLFTVRYLDVLHREYLRLRAAMKIRGFRPRMDRHTYRAYGYLVGMLLVRSFDRAERIVAAMKCRGFRGRFYLLDHFHFSRRDVPFCIASIALISAMAVLEWT